MAAASAVAFAWALAAAARALSIDWTDLAGIATGPLDESILLSISEGMGRGGRGADFLAGNMDLIADAEAEVALFQGKLALARSSRVDPAGRAGKV